MYVYEKFHIFEVQVAKIKPTIIFGFLAPASLLAELVLSKLLFESKYSKLSVKDRGGSVNCCEWAEENGAGTA